MLSIWYCLVQSQILSSLLKLMKRTMDWKACIPFLECNRGRARTPHTRMPHACASRHARTKRRPWSTRFFGAGTWHASTIHFSGEKNWSDPWDRTQAGGAPSHRANTQVSKNMYIDDSSNGIKLELFCGTLNLIQVVYSFYPIVQASYILVILHLIVLVVKSKGKIVIDHVVVIFSI